jgi:ATP-dependent exoDNAse (exonuclease V) beta subunit
MSINYIASAGTGKTYSLITEVLDKIKNEDVSIKNLLILTFTEKAATELKEKILERIKNEISNSQMSKKEKIKLHRELIFIDSGYIGTFHSVFFRLLKKYPFISKIDSSYQIISNQLDEYLDLWFEKWILEDFKKDEKHWKKITDNISLKPSTIKNAFSTLYKNRAKLKKIEINLKNQEKKIENFFNQLQILVENIKKDEELYKIIKEAQNKYPNLFKIDFNSLIEFLEKRDLNILKIEDNNNTIFKSRLSKASEKEKKFFEKIKSLRKNKNLTEIEKKLDIILLSIRDEIKDYNANILLSKFYDFLDFIEKEKKEEKLLDFEDIIQKFLNLIKENVDIREEIKNQFKYIFVDEFQDTDIHQTEILQLISDGNLYVFGDPKQCIYTWREADLDVYFNFLKNNGFVDKTLDKNYRSCPVLVEFFNKVFSENDILDHIEEKYRTKIHVGEPEKWERKECYIKLINLKNLPKEQDKKVETEAKYTAQLIKKLVEEENHKFEDIMILFRTNKDLNKFFDILSSFNIPVVSYSAQNLFKRPEILAVLNILKFIEYPESDLLKLKVLKSPLFFKKDEELIKNFDIDGKNGEILKNLIENKHSLTVEEIVETLFDKTDFLETISLEKDGKQKVENLKKLKLISKEKTKENFSLRDFILYLETYEEDLPLVEDENAVKLMTMHKSKGLESKVVIIPLISKEPYQTRLNNIHILNGIPLINISEAKAVSKGIKDYEKILKEKIKNENKRLLYVATTRAKEKLIFIQWEDGERSSSFKKLLDTVLNKIKNIIKEENVDIKEITPSPIEENKKLENIKEIFKEIEKKEKQREERHKKALTENRFTSVSQIMKEEYKEDEIKQDFSKAKEENIGIYIGVLVHDVLEKIDIKNYSFDRAKETLNSLKETVPDTYREKAVQEAEKILKNFENSPIYNELKKSNILFKELPFTLYENGKFIEGRIDIIYQKDNQIVVMDYKTNRYETDEEKQKIINAYEKQKEYYLKAVKKIFSEKEVIFKLGLLWKGEII